MFGAWISSPETTDLGARLRAAMKERARASHASPPEVCDHPPELGSTYFGLKVVHCHIRGVFCTRTHGRNLVATSGCSYTGRFER